MTRTVGPKRITPGSLLRTSRLRGFEDAFESASAFRTMALADLQSRSVRLSLVFRESPVRNAQRTYGQPDDWTSKGGIAVKVRHAAEAHGGRILRRLAVAAAVIAVVTAGLAACGNTSVSSHADPAPKVGVRATTPAPKAPVVVHRIVKERQTIPFTTQTRDDSSLANGVVKVLQSGQPGVRFTFYRVTSKDGVVAARKLIRTVVRQPIAQIKVHGTHVAAPKPSPSCDPNYSGACVPIASDVDCAGGSGNGPAYVAGPVRVVGVDIYGLDSDGDGYGCE